MDLDGWVIGRALALIGNADFNRAIMDAVKGYRRRLDLVESGTPYGVPYEPAIWGAGWMIQKFGREQYFLHAAFPDIFPKTAMLQALDFILGCHPGQV
jgi:hypothetical protein